MRLRKQRAAAHKMRLEQLESRTMLTGVTPLSNVAIAGDIPELSSNPESHRKIYLDFDGGIVDSSSLASGLETIHAEPYNSGRSDGLLVITESEQAEIERIWNVVSEDFAPFDVDVTTIDPGANYFQDDSVDRFPGVRVLVSTNIDSIDVGGTGTQWSFEAGGEAQVNSWVESPATPAWVFGNLLAWDERFIANAISHELGHTLGLTHIGAIDENGVEDERYNGHGEGETRWAPIMGNGFQGNVSQWSKGEFPGATQTRDELAIIAKSTPFREDDISVPVQLIPAEDGSVALDGLIETPEDVDTFQFTVGVSGAASLTVSPWPLGLAYGRNLDVEIRVIGPDGQETATDSPADSLTGNIELVNLNPGKYTVEVDGVGVASTDSNPGYSDYGSVGRYSVHGTITGTVSLPNAPADVNASDSTFTDRIRVAWSNSCEADVCRYEIWRSASHSSDDAQFLHTDEYGEEVASFDDFSAEPGRTYFYWVRTVNRDGTGPFGAFDSGVRGQAFPSTPQGLAVVGTVHGISLAWDHADNADTYEIRRSPNPSILDSEVIGETSSNSFFDSDGALGTEYSYWVNGKNTNGRGFPSDPVSASSELTVPSSPWVSGTNDGRMLLQWDYAFDDVDFVVEFAAAIIPTTETQLVVDLPTETTTYTVRARNTESDLNSALSEPLVVAALPAPTGVSASTPTPDAIQLTWSFDGSADHFMIRRGTSSEIQQSTQLMSVSGGSRQYQDFESVPGQAYHYWVLPVDSNGITGVSSQSVSSLREGLQAFEAVPNEQLTSESLDIEFADFDDDGYLDMFVSNKENVEIWLQDADFEFSRHQTIDVSGFQVYADVGDLDGDGDIDAVTANRGTNAAPRIWLNDFQNTGGFLEPESFLEYSNLAEIPKTQDVAIEDLNGDGMNDIVVAGDTTRIWLNNGTAVNSPEFSELGLALDFGQEQGFGNEMAVAVDLGDFNSDGCTDAYVSKPLNLNLASVSSKVFFGIGGTADSSCLLPNSNQSQLPAVWAPNEYDASNQSVFLGRESRNVAIGDLNDDGHQDVFSVTLGAKLCFFMGCCNWVLCRFRPGIRRFAISGRGTA